ncbi:hypothetical protein [Methylobacterium sp. Leaf100]|uniref:hypothetical protein n=1 Tax=Methylobacterium sp. Leaf100 TaxID=1736252 RepID=UPI000AD3182A|nr:hypothetical protein [Methylobacterium sp. Leaf100]
MPLITFLRSRWLLWQAQHHAETGRRLWLLSQEHHARAGECLDRLQAEIDAGRVVLVR